MSNRMQKTGSRVWEAFMHVCIMRPFGGAGWATTAQIAKTAGMSKPTVQKYMLLARERGAVSLHVLENRLAVWVWEK